MWMLLAITAAWAAEPELQLVAEGFSLSADTGRQVHRSLDRMFRVYEDELGLTFRDPTHMRVRLIADRATYEQEARALGLTQPTLGYFSVRTGEGVVWRNVDRAAMRSTLLHEASHFLMVRGGARAAPRWLQEGMATVFGQARAVGNAVYVDAAPGMPAWLGSSGGNLPPLGVLLADPGRIDRLPHTPVGPAAYGVGWAICAFLLRSQAGKELLTAWLALPRAGLGAGMVGEAEARWPGGVAGLDRDWRAWWARSGEPLQLPIRASGAHEQAPGWVRCPNGSLIREGSGLSCPF